MSIFDSFPEVDGNFKYRFFLISTSSHVSFRGMIEFWQFRTLTVIREIPLALEGQLQILAKENDASPFRRLVN